MTAAGPRTTLAYGPHPSQVVDVYGPPAHGPAGLRVTLLHGGYWRQRYDRSYLVPLAQALAAEGVEVALAEYRRVGGGGGWPATAEDVVAAVGSRSAGGVGRHVLVGHSAGGHLALWAVSSPAGARLAVDHVVAVAPVADLGLARRLRLSDGAVDELLGGHDEAGADPVRLVPARVPVTVLHGSDDADVPAALSTGYAAAARAAGGRVELRVLPGADHFAPLTPGTAAYDVLREAVREDPGRSAG
ncbi:putative lipase/esterase [Streptomyces mashuensis]|uniref:Lipase/esterase n=1 Tax=Streptomyces mashuensis TaxID=33904 RepID=A0A919B292_9ACTN|nr:alpha/beta hydrolase [Streptomyces mashuensis]GHF44690.1 putative lipase/esterase [Streptomyces mashuensis]